MSDAIDNHSTSIRDEFTHQADSFAAAEAMSIAETLEALVELAPEDPGARWVELASGPGLVTRALAPREIERLRDPSHWASLTVARLAALGGQVGLEPDSGRVIPFGIDWDEWLHRGSGGPVHAELIERLLGEAPAGVESFIVSGEGDERVLGLRNALFRWRVP